jgi:diadenosine tetraphosphate (Ap4A) HIT family hydrolase
MAKLLIGTTRYFSVAHADFCRIPGYLILEPLTAAPHLWMLPDQAQIELGRLQASCAQAIQELVSPERIYYLVFAEENPVYHCHIFPRSAEATARYREHFPEKGPSIRGPLFFDWARDYYKGDASGDPEIADVIGKLAPLIGLH